MAVPQVAVEKYQRNTANAAPRWAAGVQRVGAAGYCEGIARFLGQPVGPCVSEEGANWQAAVQGAQQRYQAGVQGKGQAWLEGYRRRFAQ